MTTTLSSLRRQEKRDNIKTAIDQCENFAEFLELVAEICAKEANNIQEEDEMRNHDNI